jgi:hypothetical protein
MELVEGPGFAGVAEIPNEEDLWRRIWPRAYVPGEGRPISGAFRDSRGQLSVHRSSRTTPAQALAGRPSFGLVAFSAGFVRNLDGYDVYPDPTAEDPSHCVIKPKLTGAHADELARHVTWVVPMPGLGNP